jgi:hypothetical protein
MPIIEIPQPNTRIGEAGTLAFPVGTARETDVSNSIPQQDDAPTDTAKSKN